MPTGLSYHLTGGGINKGAGISFAAPFFVVFFFLRLSFAAGKGVVGNSAGGKKVGMGALGALGLSLTGGGGTNRGGVSFSFAALKGGGINNGGTSLSDFGGSGGAKDGGGENTTTASGVLASGFGAKVTPGWLP